VLGRGEPAGWLHGAARGHGPATDPRHPHHLGSPLFAEFVLDTDAIAVERMRRAGAIVIGKTNVPEFGLGSQTYNDVFGTTRNAYDPARTAGGSSGGAAVALALRMLPVADGSDHAGSLRNPAAFNNVLGFRTTFGCVPSAEGDVFLPALGVIGPMARTATDLALLLSVLAGHDPRAPLSSRDAPAGSPPSIATSPAPGSAARRPRRPPVQAQLEPPAPPTAFGAIGCTVDEVRVDYAMGGCGWLVLRAYQVGSVLRSTAPTRRGSRGSSPRRAGRRGARLTAYDLADAQTERTA
jgi:amidase